MDSSQTATTVAMVAGFGIGAVGVWYCFTSRGDKHPPKRAENTVYLHVSKPNKLFGLFSPSLWGLKLETWLRITKLPHEVIRTETAAKYSPDGTLPFIEYNGQYISQHRDIVQHLTTAAKANPDASLTPAQRATGYLVERLVDRSLASLLVTHARRMHPLVVRRDLQRCLPPLSWLPDVLVAPLVVAAIHKRKAAECALTEERRRAEVKADLAAISDLLGNNTYITGSAQPASVDATVFALLTCATEAAVKDDEIARWLGTLNGGNLVRYAERMKSAVWSDWWSNQERLQYRAGS